MEWALGNQISIRTIAVGCAVAVVCATALTERPKALPLHISFPSISFNLGTASAAPAASVVTVTQDEAKKATAVVTSVDDVHSQQEVVSYADALMQADPRIVEVEMGENSVSMTYKTTHRILNVRTISDQTRATVREDGTVTVAGSWVRPLFSRVAQASTPNIGFSDISMTDDVAGISPATEARILTRLHGRFQIGAIQ